MSAADHHPQPQAKHVECHAVGRRPNSAYCALEQRRLIIAMIITGVTMVLEAVGGWLTGSLALLSDAGHMFSHLFALGISYIAILLACRPADDVRSFGFYRAEILAALANGLTLIIIAAWICYEAYHRFLDPQVIESGPMFVIATIGLVVNVVTAGLLHAVAQEDINVRGAFLHVIGDLASSVGVIGAAIVIFYTGWWPADPIVSVVIALVIAYWSLGLLKDAVHILLQSTPKELSHGAIASALIDGIEEIRGVHHIHVWELTQRLYVMTAHIVLDDIPLGEADSIRCRAQDLLHDQFHITHANLQLESRRPPS